MKNWVNKNYKTIIIAAFLVPIITVAVVSISHVTMWYGLSNPFTWAIYLSIGIEIAALSALAAISADMGSKVYFPFSIVTLIQFIGNIFFAYTFIDVDSKTFKDWVDLVSPLVYYLGVEPTDFVGHKRFLALFAGGMLPVISLSFLHMLVKFTEEDRKNKVVEEPKEQPKEEPKEEPVKIDASDLVAEVSKVRLSENDLKKLEEILLSPPSPNEELIKAAERYRERTDDEILKQAEDIRLKRELDVIPPVPEVVVTPEPIVEKVISPEPTITPSIVEIEDNVEPTPIPQQNPSKEERESLIIEMMKNDEELGLYDEPFDNPIIREDNEVVPALSDEEVNEMTLNEWERKEDDNISDWDVTLMDGLEEELPENKFEIDVVYQEESPTPPITPPTPTIPQESVEKKKL
jgi:hypothetical protein